MALSDRTKERLFYALTDRTAEEEVVAVVDGLVDGSVLTPAKVLDTDTTFYVDVTLGSDTTGDGSAAKPWAQIQSAINYLQDYEVRALVIVNVAAGTYDGVYLAGLKFTYAVSPASGSPGLQIVGAKTAPTLTTGTASGTTTAGSAGVLTDTTQNWTVNELAGQCVEWTSGTTVLRAVVLSNTATTATITTSSSIGTGLPYSFFLPGTTISCNKTFIANATSASTAAGVILGHVAAFQNGQLTCKYLALSNSNGRMIYSNSAAALGQFQSCTFNCTSVNVAAITLTGSTTFSGCKFTSAYTSATATFVATTDQARATISTSYFKNATQSGVAVQPGSGGTVNLTINYYENYATAIAVSAAATAVLAASVSFGGTFVNNITVFSSARRDCTAFTLASVVGGVASSGNTNGVVLTKGAWCNVTSTMTLGATTELSVDGVTGTLAALRAASPKTFPTTPNIYGTLVYE